MKLTIKSLFIGLSCCFGSALSVAQDSSMLAPPAPKVVDEFGVDLATGQVVASVQTLSIGGELGLSHSIRPQTNDMNHIGNYAFTDSYSGNATYIDLGTTIFLDGEGFVFNENVVRGVMRLFGPLGTHDFGVYVNGELRPDHNIPNITSVP